jgi:hypothetical protein
VRLGEPSIGAPHDLLQFPELSKEAGVAVVDLLCACCHVVSDVSYDAVDVVLKLSKRSVVVQ